MRWTRLSKSREPARLATEKSLSRMYERPSASAPRRRANRRFDLRSANKRLRGPLVWASISPVRRTGVSTKHWLYDLSGAGLAIALGLGALALRPLGLRIEEWSYDLPYA